MEVAGDLVYKLKKALYGLRTAPRRWQQKLRAVLASIGFTSLKHDQNVFRREDIMISTYVDDFMVLNVSDSVINAVIR